MVTNNFYSHHLNRTEAAWGLPAPKPPGADGKEIIGLKLLIVIICNLLLCKMQLFFQSKTETRAEALAGRGFQPALLRGRRETKIKSWKVLIYMNFGDLP